EQPWGFPLAVAQFGMLSDIPYVRRFLASRTRLPNSEVSRTCLYLFDAYTAQRNGQHMRAREYAVEAVKRFRALGWHGYAEAANALLPTAEKIPLIISPETRFSNTLLTLTARERQVAELALKGLTNRQIAEMLAIKERTVEA